MKKALQRILIIALICSAGTITKAQDTLITNYPDSKKVWEKLFEEGNKIKETIYYENGQIWMTASYDPNKQETWNWFHQNGKPFFSATIIEDELHGNYQIWYENGQLAESLNFVDNIEQGEATFWHSNGQLAIKGVYQDGRMMGKWIFYDQDGQPANGKWIWKFAALDQFVRMEGIVENGERTGVWRYKGTADRGREGQLVFEESIEN